MFSCGCVERHRQRRIVLTGGPGAGKTALIELVRQSFCDHIVVLPEAAGIVFGGGFPRLDDVTHQRAAQRAIFYVQRELEAAAEGTDAALVLCDRGTVDGAAYWPGPGEFWPEVGTAIETELARYAAVIHLATPAATSGYNHQNPLRVESAERAAALDTKIRHVWERHPHRWVIEADTDFFAKAARAVAILRDQLPACCRGHVIAPLAAYDDGRLRV
jgi:predicted ATPase